MPQLHFYVADDVASQLKQQAQEAGISTSRYIADLVRNQLQAEWPEGYFEEVVGGWQGEALARAPQGEYEQRDILESHGPE